MDWETLAALITIALAGISVGKVIYELSKTLTKLNCSVDMLTKALSALTCENSEEHKELFGAVDELYHNVTDLEHKIDERSDNE